MTEQESDESGLLARSPAKPSATTKTPIVKNPSTPGVQRPGNTPIGRSEPVEGEIIKR